MAVGGCGRLARPQLPPSATCKQALGGRRLLQSCVGLGLGTGNWGLRLGAAHPAQSRASAAPSSTCLLPALVPSQGTVSLHTPPFPLPAPRYCIVRCVRAAPSGKAPTAPRSFCLRVHLAAPPSPSKAERRNALETHQTHLGMAENRTQLGFFFLNYTTLTKSKCSLQSLKQVAEGGVRRGSPEGTEARGWHPPRPGHGRGIRSRGAAGKPRSSSRPEALEARQGGEAAGRALQPGSCGGEIQYHPSGSAARRRVARRAGSLRSALGASSECRASEEEEEEQSRAGSLLGRRVGGGDGRGGGRGLGFFLGAFPVLAAAALAPRRWL